VYFGDVGRAIRVSEFIFNLDKQIQSLRFTFFYSCSSL
jgi:hypothetical protein